MLYINITHPTGDLQYLCKKVLKYLSILKIPCVLRMLFCYKSLSSLSLQVNQVGRDGVR